MSLDFLDADDWDVASGEHPTWSMDQIDSHPLFMSALKPDASNPYVEALQSVLYDDETPYGICHNFKEQGNSAMSRGLIDDAVIFYKKASEVVCDHAPLMCQVHCNLALAFLKKRQYPECVDECYKAIGFDNDNVKAFYRGALASLHLELYSQAIYFAKGGLAVDSQNESLCEVFSKIQEAKTKQDELKKSLIVEEAKTQTAKPKYRWQS